VESKWLPKTDLSCTRTGYEVDQHLPDLGGKKGETPLQEENADAGADQWFQRRPWRHNSGVSSLLENP